MKVFPLHHTIVERKTAPSGKTFRVILLDSGEFEPLILYFASLRKRANQQSWQRKVARSVGMFLDFIIQCGHNYKGKGQAQNIFWGFANALADGTIPSGGGEDQTGLYWPVHEWSKQRDILNSVKEFSDWCVRNFGARQLVISRESTLAERIAIYKALDKKSENSFFAHLHSSKKNWKEAGTTDDLRASFLANRGTSVIRSEPPRFQKDLFPKFVFDGFLKYGGQKHSAPWKRYHIRDMMISILQGAAGLRASEAFHLFVDDVFDDPKMPGHAMVRLYHPCEGKYTYLDPVTGKERKTTRQNYLRTIGMTPRNLAGGKFHAGWKNLALYKDPGDGEIYAPVTFFPTYWGKIFWQLYCLYLFHVRPHDKNHPFLFVNEKKGKTYGQPYNLSQYIKKHEKAVQRVLRKVAKQHEGTTTHGLRHMFGRRVKVAVAGIEDEIKAIQFLLRHRSDKAQEIYTMPSLSEIRKALTHAESEIDLPQIPGGLT